MDRGPVRYPRDAAVRVLGKVLGDGQVLDEALRDAVAADPSMARDPRAIAWLQDVCSGTLRWRGRLDRVIDSAALKKKPTGWLRRALQVGAYQLVVQERRVAAAAVSETVTAVKKKEGEAPSRFANAVLRKIAEQAGAWRNQDLREDRGPAEQAAWASLPEWWWRRLVKERGFAWARAYAQACLERPQLWLRARENADFGPAAGPGPVPRSYRVTQGGAASARPGFAEGGWIVQDISSQKLVSEGVAEARSRGLGREFTALDLCASPGGKAIALAWEGARVMASDRDSRLGILRESVERVNAGAAVTVLAQAELRARSERFDWVWVDAPCTGSGIIRRHPDVRWLREEKELGPLKRAQSALLEEGWSRVRSGGFLLYSVCSVFAEEGIGVLEGAKLPGARRVRTWDLSPQDEPYGDGFWGGLLAKEGE